MDAGQPCDDAVDQLPAPYAVALRLRAAGVACDEIAARIGVQPEAMDAVLRIAEAKLNVLRRIEPSSSDPT